jgi:transposase
MEDHLMPRTATPAPRTKRRRHENRQPQKRQPGWRDVPEEFWKILSPLIPDHPIGPKGGRRPKLHRVIFNGILYVLRTGCQWKMMPREYGSGSSAHRHFQAWVRCGVFHELWRLCLQQYDDLKGIDWQWQTVDSATVSAPVKGGIASARTPRTGPSWAPNAMSRPTATASR